MQVNKQKMVTHLYGLVDPITNKIRYIGYTTKTIYNHYADYIK